MSLILSAEWYKLKRSRTLLTLLLVCVGVYIINFATLLFMGKTEFAYQAIDDVISNFTTWQIVLTAFVSYFYASEFASSTIRQPIALGKSRLALYLSKLLSFCVVTAMLLAFISVFCLLGCALLFGFGGTAVGATLVVWVIGLVKLVLYMWPYAALFLMIAFVTRSSVSAAIFGFVYVIAEQLGTQLVLPAVFDGRLMWMSRLFPSYYIQRIGTNSDNIVVALAMCLGFAIITTAIGYGVFQKRDVK